MKTKMVESATKVVLRNGAGGAKAARARVSDPTLQRELKASLEALTAAFERARKVGLRNVTDDKKLTKDLNQTLEHASKALSSFQSQKTGQHRLRWVVVSVLLAGGYGEWMRRNNDWGRSQPA